MNVTINKQFPVKATHYRVGKLTLAYFVLLNVRSWLRPVRVCGHFPFFIYNKIDSILQISVMNLPLEIREQ